MVVAAAGATAALDRTKVTAFAGSPYCCGASAPAAGFKAVRGSFETSPFASFAAEPG